MSSICKKGRCIVIINKLTVNEQKLRDLHLRDILIGEKYGPLTGYISKDKPWLKYYSKEEIESYVDPKMTMYQYMMKKNKDRLNDIVINYFDRNITFKEFNDMIDKCVCSFKKYNIKKGDIVTICMPNTPEAIMAIYALNKMGAVCNMVHPLSSEEEIKHYVREVDSKMIITIDLAYDKVMKVIDDTNLENVVVVSPADSMPILTKTIYKMAKDKIKLINDKRKINWNKFIEQGKDEIVIEEPYEEDRLAVIMHTGGTTGTPKGVMLSDDNFNCMVEGFFKNANNFSRGDKILTIMPVFHGFGLCSSIHLPLSVGVTTILVPQLDKKNFHKLIIKHHPNHLIGVPTLYKALITNKKLSNVEFDFLKYVVSGGDFVKDSLEEEINKFLKDHGSNAELAKGFGLSEVVAGATFAYGDYNKVGSNGIPMVNMNMKIVKPGTDCELLIGEVGEICLSGPSVMMGYFNNQDETKSTLINGWLHTGDLGYVDQNGILYFVQRKGNMIISSGYNVYPTNIEKVIEEHPLVSRCAVVGVHDSYRIQVPVALIELKNDIKLTEEMKNKLNEEIKELCIKKLNKYSQPASILYGLIPLTKLGKTNYAELKDMLDEDVKKKIRR